MSSILPLIFSLFLLGSCGKHEQEGKGVSGISNTVQVKAEPLSQYVLEENVPALTKFAAGGGNLETELESGRTLLTEACQWAKFKVIEFLISRKVSLDRKDRNGKSALDYGNEDIAIKRALFPELVIEQKRTLFLAVKNSQIQDLKVILEEDPPLNFTLTKAEIGDELEDMEGETLVTFIVKRNLFNVLRLLAAPKYVLDVNLPNARGEVALKLARALTNSNMEKLLLKLGAKDE